MAKSVQVVTKCDRCAEVIGAVEGVAETPTSVKVRFQYVQGAALGPAVEYGDLCAPCGEQVDHALLVLLGKAHTLLGVGATKAFEVPSEATTQTAALSGSVVEVVTAAETTSESSAAATPVSETPKKGRGGRRPRAQVPETMTAPPLSSPATVATASPETAPTEASAPVTPEVSAAPVTEAAVPPEPVVTSEPAVVASDAPVADVPEATAAAVDAAPLADVALDAPAPSESAPAEATPAPPAAPATSAASADDDPF